MLITTCKAPINIAVIKYWGKRNEELLLPINDSISITLDTKQVCAKTTICLSKKFTKDRMWLNGTEVSVENPRIQNCLREIRNRVRKQKLEEGDSYFPQHEDISSWSVHISSVNNFPTAAGLASSAAGYAGLVYALSKVYKLDTEISDIARVGSGSACRSVYGGFVQWLQGKANDGSDSIAVQLKPASHWPEIQLLILVVNDQRKPISSTKGMKIGLQTSKFLDFRAKNIVPQRISAMQDAINTRDFQEFAKITMQDSNQMHAVCLDTWPPIHYLTDTSFYIIDLVHKLNDYYGEIKVGYTFDAGPNAVLITLEPMIHQLINIVHYYFSPDNESLFQDVDTQISYETPSQEVLTAINLERRPKSLKYVVHTKLGDGPLQFDDETEHLLNEDGMPK